MNSAFKKIKASTLPEVLVSLVVIMAVFSVGITILMRITFSGLSFTDNKVKAEMNSIISRTEQGSNWEDETLLVDSVNYFKTIEQYEESPDLFVIDVKAEQNEKTVGKASKIVSKPANQNANAEN